MILDTNAVSALAESDPVAVRVLLRKGSALIPVIVLGEYRFGIAQSRKRKEYEDWLRDFIVEAEILPIDEQTATFYAKVREELKTSGRPIPSNDIWIAALCRQHGMPIMSRDSHFDFVTGIQRVSW